MKKFFQVLSLALCLVAVMSFKSVSERDMIGIYGGIKDDPGKIQLQINADHTFTYQDHSNPNQIVVITGRWEKQEEFIVLKDYVATYKLHDIWKVSADGKVARSKMGITIHTLLKQEGC